ncbi:MAG TPA: NAD(P)-dependent oxidoreductase [Acidimicrobiales bacterium]|nr:NAD(P)-dependent oxidoreductase [Acidimicrobiales bacterium]
MTTVPATPHPVTMTVAHEDVLRALVAAGVPDGARVVLWDVSTPFADRAGALGVEAGDVDVVVVPNYGASRSLLGRLDELPRLSVVQLPSAGYEHALPHIRPSVTVCNGRGVHDAGTAELALGLALASQRGIDDAVRDAADGTWVPRLRSSLADRRVMVLGYGSIGAAVARRLQAFEAEVVPVASAPRDEDGGRVHGVGELLELLPEVDIVIVTLPLTEATERLVDARFLAAMPDGALLVNVGRGRVVDTAALLAELGAGRLRAALDVTDPEPLPPEHPLWRAPGVIVTPHVGGYTDATTPRLAALLRRQLMELVAGRPPLNVVRARTTG